jgi:hypothetical protein
MMLLNLRFRCRVVCVRAIETHASCGPGSVDVRTQHVPAFAQMQHPVVPLCRPTPGCDSNSFFLCQYAALLGETI